MKSNSADSRPVVLIGPVCDDHAESVSAVNKAFMEGLSERYRFVAPSANRKYGTTRQSRLNFWNVYYLLKHLLAWFWALVRYRPEIAHYAVSSGWAMEKGLIHLGLARLFGARTVGHLHSGGFPEHWRGLSPSRREFAAAQLAKLDAFIVLSESWSLRVSELLGLPNEKLAVVNNPIAAQFESIALDFPLPRPVLQFLALGVMGRDKGVFDILEAARQLRAQTTDFKIVLAGPEREPGIRQKIAAEIAAASLGENVAVHASVIGAEKLQLFREAAVFLLPSYYENFPLVVLEAAAAGQAIIASPVGATPEFFQHETSAIFVPPGDPTSLAQAMIRISQSPELRLQLGAAAREIFRRKLSRARIMESLERVYLQFSRNLHVPCRNSNQTSSDQSEVEPVRSLQIASEA